MTPSSDLDTRVTHLLNRLSYVLLYAPVFPTEDGTTVEREFDMLLTQVHALWREVQDLERRRWLDLMGLELVEARAAFLAGDTKSGCSLVQSAEERLADWVAHPQEADRDFHGGVRRGRAEGG